MQRSRQHLLGRHLFVPQLLLHNLEPQRFGQRLLRPRVHNLLLRDQRLPRLVLLPGAPVRRRARADRHGQTRRFGPPEIAVLCLQEIADLCPTFRANVQADRVRGNPFVRNNRARADHGPEENLRVLSNIGAGRCRPGHALGLVRLVARECCRRCPTKCRQRQSRESPFTRAKLRLANGRSLTNARLKGSANCIRRVRVRERAGVRLPRQSSRRPNHVRHEK